MKYFYKKWIKIASIAVLLTLAIFFVFSSRMIPSFGIKIIVNNNVINYLKISDEIYYRQTINNCAPYAVMGVINVLTGEKKDPELLVKETKWRIMKNMTFPQGVIDLLRKHNIKTKEYSMKLYSNDDKINWLKNKIDNGNPIILLVKVKNIQHYFTVIGYDENGFMLYDSLQEKQDENTMKTKIDRKGYMGNRYYTNDELTGLWNNGGYKIFFRNWAVVCYKTENQKPNAVPKLSFSMTEEEIVAYYQLIDSLVDKEPNPTIDLGEVDYETKERIITERSDKSKYFENDVEFKFENMTHVWTRTPVKPDGYINFNNYWYRNIDTSHVPEKNFIQYSEDRINPLKTNPGFIITEYDMPVYIGIYEDGVFVGRKEAGLIKSGTVLKIDYVSNDDYAHVVRIFSFQGSIKLTDIDFIARLRESVSYKIIDNKLYRFIEGQKIEIEPRHSGYTEEGLKYIRNENNNHLLTSFYFWEKTGDYLFDDEGNLVDIVKYGPDWTGI